MLNKLLKRCMPWMDKGSWHSFRVVGSDPSNFRTVFNSDEISSAVISMESDPPVITVTTKHVPHIIDFKFCPENNVNFIVLPSLDLGQNADNIFEVPLQGPGTYWFFIRNV